MFGHNFWLSGHVFGNHIRTRLLVVRTCLANWSLYKLYLDTTFGCPDMSFQMKSRETMSRRVHNLFGHVSLCWGLWNCCSNLSSGCSNTLDWNPGYLQFFMLNLIFNWLQTCHQMSQNKLTSMLLESHQFFGVLIPYIPLLICLKKWRSNVIYS